MALANGNTNGEQGQPITFKVPADLKRKFDAKYKDRGKRSRILRGLLQMFMDGKIPTVVFKTEDKIVTINN
jgi:hypothetical protein